MKYGLKAVLFECLITLFLSKNPAWETDISYFHLPFSNGGIFLPVASFVFR